MYNEERSKKRRLYVASFSQDIPNVSPGELIPRRTIYSAPDTPEHTVRVWYLQPSFLLTLSVLLFGVSIGTTTYSVLKGSSSVAAPIIATESIQFEPEPFNYGLAIEANEENITDEFNELIASGEHFVEIDLTAYEVRYYEDGVASTTFEVVTKPETNSWWYIPTGRYDVDRMYQKMYSSFANIYLPFAVQFGENFYLHGHPYYPDGQAVPEQYTGGGARLSDTDAEALFALIQDKTPVLVRNDNKGRDSFVYETRVEGVHARQYLVADVRSSTVLAANDLKSQVPIASLVKFMTALVAAEHIDLDRNVPIYQNGDSIVASLIPRLESGYTASMYSLLQLLLVESSNEAAEVIASVLGRDTFIRLMNEKAAALGLTNSHFADPSGLSSENTASVEDLFRLTQYIYENRGFILELTADQNLPTAYTNGQFGVLANFNRIEGVDFVAGKVGETEAAGQTSVSLHRAVIKGEERIIAVVVLGTDSRTEDVHSLLSFVRERFGE